MRWNETRRRKALRWTALFAVLLALYIVMLQKDPRAARMDQEEHHGTGRTQVVAELALWEKIRLSCGGACRSTRRLCW